MVVRLSATGQVVHIPPGQAASMLAAGTAELVRGLPGTERIVDAVKTSRAVARKPDAGLRARKSVWMMIGGELAEAAGVLAVLAGLAFAWRDLALDIPIVCGLLALYVGRLLRR